MYKGNWLSVFDRVGLVALTLLGTQEFVVSSEISDRIYSKVLGTTVARTGLVQPQAHTRGPRA